MSEWVDADAYFGGFGGLSEDGYIYGLSADEAAAMYPGLFGLGDDGERIIQKFTKFISSFPKPGSGQGVRADVLLQALRQLMPLAQKVAGMRDGAAKRGIIARTLGPAESYFTGPNITTADKDTAGRIIYEINVRLPSMGTQAVHPDIYGQIKDAALQLLKIGSDLGEDATPIADAVARIFSSVSEAVVELPETLQKNIPRPPAFPDLVPTWLKVTIAGGVVLAGLAVYSFLKAAAPYAGGYVAVKTGMRGIGGIGEIRKHRGKTIVCFKARRSRRSRRREEVCFPARRKR